MGYTIGIVWCYYTKAWYCIVSLYFCELGAHAQFRNPTTTPSGLLGTVRFRTVIFRFHTVIFLSRTVIFRSRTVIFRSTWLFSGSAQGATSTPAHLIFTKPWFYQNSSVPEFICTRPWIYHGSGNIRKKAEMIFAWGKNHEWSPLRAGCPCRRAFPSACDHF